MAFDLAMGCSASVGVAMFFKIFLATTVDWWIAVAPVVLLGVNSALGIYSRLRMSTTQAKITFLLLGVLIVALALGFVVSNMSQVVLWAMLVGPPLTLGRLLLAPHQRKHQNLVSTMIRRRGPTLVTGGAGYIGSGLVDLLLTNGHSVRVLDRLMYGSDPIQEFRTNPRFELIEGDVADISKLTQAMQGTSAIVHLAGLVGDPACAVDSKFTRQMNVISTQLVKDVAQSLGVHRFIFASSCSVYGVSDKEVKENDPLNPVSLYAQTKIDSEQELLASARDDFFVTILRFATVFGHSRRPRFDLVANLFTAQAMNEGLITVVGPSQWRPFIHVNDLARAVLMTLEADPATVQGQIFNVGDKNQNLTILQLAEYVKAVTERFDRKVEISVREQKANDLRNYAASFEKIRKTLGFEAATSMEAGITEMAEHFNRGTYTDYRAEIYSNVATTKKTMSEFYEPLQATRIYAPVQIES